MRETLTEREKLAGKESFLTAILGVSHRRDCEFQANVFIH